MGPFVYKQTEPQLWTTGHYDPATSKFVPEKDCDSKEEAAERVHWLNGGNKEKEPTMVRPAEAKRLRKNQPTAEQEIKRLRDEITARLKRLQVKTNKCALEHPKDWTYFGDLGHINAVLAALLGDEE